MFCSKNVRGPQMAALLPALLAAAFLLAGACSLDFSFGLPQKLEITGTPEYTASAGGILDEPVTLDDLFTIGDIKKAVEDGDSDARVFEYRKTGSDTLTYLFYYPVDEEIDEEQEIPAIEKIKPEVIPIPDVEFEDTINFVIPLNVPESVLNLMISLSKTVVLVPGSNPPVMSKVIDEEITGNPVSVKACQQFLGYMADLGKNGIDWNNIPDPTNPSQPIEDLTEYKDAWNIPINIDETLLDMTSQDTGEVTFISARVDGGTLTMGLEGFTDSTTGDPSSSILDLSDMDITLYETGTNSDDGTPMGTPESGISLDGIEIFPQMNIKAEGMVSFNIEEFTSATAAVDSATTLTVAVTLDKDSMGLKEVHVEYEIKDVGEKVTQNLGDLTQIQYIALKEAGFNLELQAFINNKDEGETDETGPVFDEDDDYPVALEGLTVMVTAPLLSIDKTHAFELAHWDGEGKFTLDVPGEKTFINGPGSREMVKIVPNQDKNLNEGDTILDVEAKAYNTDSINNELVLMVDPRLPLTKASLVIAMVPSLNIEWGGAQVKGFYEIDDVADLTEDLEDDLLEDIGRIGIDGIIPRFYLPKSNVSVDVDTSGNTSRKDLLEGATINLSAEYTTKGAVEQPVPILSGAAFTPTPASGFSGFQEFLDDHTGISEPDWVYEEAAANSLPVSRLPLGKEVADTLVNIINKKPQTLKLHYTITLAEELVGVQPPGKDNAVIINIPRPELLLEVPMKLRLKKPANDPDDPAGYARLDLTPFLDEYLPDWQEVLEVKEDGKTLRQKIEDQGVTNLSAKVTVSASYTNTITSGAEAWVTLWEKKDNGEKGGQRLPPQRLAVNSGAGTSSFSFDAGLADLEKNYMAEVELRLPIVSGQDYGILEVKRGGTFELIQVSATVAASVTIEKDLPWSKK